MKRFRLKALLPLTLSLVMVMGLATSAYADGGYADDLVVNTTHGDGNDPATYADSNHYALVTISGGEKDIAYDDDSVTRDSDDVAADIGVWAKVNVTGSIVYKIDINWGDMKFEYRNTDQVWNPATHLYETSNATAGWVIDGYVNGTNNEVTVWNHSNASVDVAYYYEHTLVNEGADSLFNDGWTNLETLRGTGSLTADQTTASNKLVRGHLSLTNDEAIAFTQYDTSSLTKSITGAEDILIEEKAWTAPSATTNKQNLPICPVGASVEAGTVPSTSAYFTFNGVPDYTSGATLSDFTRVGTLSVLVAPVG